MPDVVLQNVVELGSDEVLAETRKAAMFLAKDLKRFEDYPMKQKHPPWMYLRVRKPKLRRWQSDGQAFIEAPGKHTLAGVFMSGPVQWRR